MTQSQKENRSYSILWFLTVILSVGGSVAISLLFAKGSPQVKTVPAVAAVEPAKTPGASDDGKTLAEGRGCMVCHKIDSKVVGPAYLDVAKKYKGDPKAPELLSAKIIKGGSGTWGAIPMPPQAQLSPEEAAKLAAWVLALSSD